MPPALVWVPSQRPVVVSVASVTSVANDNEMILGVVHRSPGICLTAEENPRKPQLGRQSDEGAVRPVIIWGPFLPNEVIRKGEGRKYLRTDVLFLKSSC